MYKVILEHINYKCTAELEDKFNTREEAEQAIKEHNNSEYNYYIKEGE